MSDTGWRGRWFCFLDVVICSRPGSRACGGRVLVTRVVSPVSSRESWTVLGDDDAPVAPIERYLRYLTDIERSPNTIKAYAHDLKDWFTFLAGRGPDWPAVRRGDGGPAGGRRRVRVVVAVADGVAAERDCDATHGGASLRRGDGEPEAVGAGGVLHLRRPRRRRGR